MIISQHQSIGFHSDTKWPKGPENGAIPFENEGPFTDVDKEIIKRHAIACKVRQSNSSSLRYGLPSANEGRHSKSVPFLFGDNGC